MIWLRRLSLALLGRYRERLRFPGLLLITGIVFVVDLLLPDGLPFLDEIVLGILAAIFATWQGGGAAGDESEDRDA